VKIKQIINQIKIKIMEIKNIKVEDKKVTFYLEDYRGEHIVEFTKRYFFDTRSRWNFEINEIKRYFLANAPKGSVIGGGEDYFSKKEKHALLSNKISNVFVWDLKKIFPNVDFIENDDFRNEILNVLNINSDYHTYRIINSK
jgi:hypothetical protein